MAAKQGATMNDNHKSEGALHKELAVARQRIADLETALSGRDIPGVESPVPSSPALPTAFQATFANSLPGILFLFDAQARLLWWNEEFERATGYSATELARAAASHFIPAESLPLVLEHFQAAVDTGSAELEVFLVRKDGAQVPYHCT